MFLDSCRDHLASSRRSINNDKVTMGWETALRSSRDFEHEVDCVSLMIAETSLWENLNQILGNGEKPSKQDEFSDTKGLDLMSIQIKFDMPVKLIFTHGITAKYELIFRLMIRLVDLSRELSRAFSSSNPNVSKKWHLLRRQMLNFVENLQQFLVYEVLEPSWLSFMESVNVATGLDEVVNSQNKFLDSCLRRSLLTNSKLMRTLHVLFNHCSRLITWSNSQGAETNSLDASTLEADFNKTMRLFLEALQYFSSRDYDYHLGSLYSRLDFNSYYSVLIP